MASAPSIFTSNRNLNLDTYKLILGSSSDSTKFVFDGNTNRLGINKASPSHALDVTGNIGFSGNLVQSTATNASIDISGSTTTRYLRVITGANGTTLSGVGSTTSALVLRAGGSGIGAYISADNNVGIKLSTVTAALHLPAGTATASTAPLKFTSGTLLTTPEAGAVEFLTDKAYLTITTGAARKEVTLNDAALTSGTTPVATTNGRLTDGVILTSSTFTATVTQSGSDTLQNSAQCYGHFTRVGSIVTFTVRIEIALTSAGSSNTVYFDPPIASDFTVAESDAIGAANLGAQSLSGANTAQQRCILFASDSDDKIGISFDPVASLTYPENRQYISASGSYVIQ
jgi:hypothetical protein